MEELPLDVRAGQVIMVAVYGDSLDAGAAVVEDGLVGGVVIMTWPPEASSEALQALKHAGAIPLLVAVDEEGGRVQRMRRLGNLPAARDAVQQYTPHEIERVIAAHARAIAATGVDLVFAPVLDVAPQAGEGPLLDRTFSSDPSVVAAYAAAYVRGWSAAGIIPVLKHFPGHGRASADTHEAEGVTPHVSDLRAWDLTPYEQFRTTPGLGVMVGHLSVPGLTDAEGLPASLSAPAISSMLRSEYGFHDALVVTDALDMDAVTRTMDVPPAAVKALAAGADVALHMSLSETPSVHAALVAAVEAGTLAESRLDDAVARILRAKGVDPCSLTGQ